MIWFLILIGLLYAILIIALTIGFGRVDEFNNISENPTTKFSVIIPFRNEAKNLPNLLQSIQLLNYPKELVEFLFVDDDSTDDSVAAIKDFFDAISQTNFQVLKNNRTSKSPKKDAISTAISKAKHNWIVTTDADCVLSKNWLSSLDSFIQKNNSKMIVAPVNYKAKNNLLEQFQLLDFMSMQGTTIGGFGIDFPFLCNGANLAYKKGIFLQLNGFEGNSEIASGDDVFLFEKFIKSDKKSVHYLKSQAAIVTTFPVKSWSGLIQQRKRWAAKTSNFNSIKVKLIGVLIVLTNLFVFSFLCIGSIKTMYIPIAIKLIIDWCLFKPTLSFFNHKMDFVKWYVPASIIYPIFNLVIAVLAVTTTYNWKGRKFKA
ncbi:glycosyltransferase [Polaribacter septentrionalilitoris]|uniref:glycosyltransferase n=1 Tax=Polaribacter septentrionalilitoris TaxID=2494657 RepID=UPI001359E417|nr:glycosyltransferase [Polaribacter septentrionalilitoris]